MELSAFRRLPSVSMHDIDLLLEKNFFIFGCTDEYIRRGSRWARGGGGGREEGGSIANRAHIHCDNLIYISM